MNLNLYCCDGKWLIVDMGISFSDQPGVDIVMPDIRFLEDKLDDIVGLVLTHGHEDHIGAIPYLWEKIRCPMYATPFTAEVIRNKIKETSFKNAPIIEVPLSGRIDLKPFNIEFITLTHSIPEPNALAIRTSYGTVMHTGDWKIDPNPLVGEITNADRLKAVGDEGVLALVCDSTNVFHEGTSGSEGAIRETLIDVIKRYPKQRIIIACFSFNIARMETAAVAASATRRTIVAIGRSLEKMEMAARYAGYLKKSSKFQNDTALKDLADENTLILCTGSQGEGRSALARIAAGSHPSVRLGAGDVVIFSARTIPGNEKSVGAIQNKLTRAGVTVITASEEDIHVSGHPHRDELQQMFEWVRPKTLIPVHGEARHLYEHRRFGLACGIPHVVIPNNGTLICLSQGPAIILTEDIPVGRLVMDGTRLIAEGSMILKQRNRLAINGFLQVSMALTKKKELQGSPLLGIHGLTETGAETQQLAQELSELICDIVKEGHKSIHTMKDAISQALRRHCNTRFGKKPVTEVHVIEG